MTSTLMISQIAQWLLLGILTLVVLMLARQIGLIHKRLPPPPAKALPQGIPIGEEAPAFSELDLSGRRVSHVLPGKSTLLVFIAPRCPTCDELLPGVHAVARGERHRMQTILISMGDRKSTLDIVKRRHIDLPVVVSEELSDIYNVYDSPFAQLLDESGVARAGGLVNHLEHLESVVYAPLREKGAPSEGESENGRGSGDIEGLPVMAGKDRGGKKQDGFDSRWPYPTQAGDFSGNQRERRGGG